MIKIINTALCSFGGSGMYFHAPFIHSHPGFRLYGVWERSNKHAAETYPGIISFNSFDELLADRLITLVVVNTPVYTHFEYAMRALQAGKHVLVEKAFTVNAGEATELAALAEELDLVLCVFQNRRWDSDFKTVQAVLAQGILGKIMKAELHFDRYQPQLSPKLHKENAEPGSGLLHDLGPHLVDQALVLFGMPHAVSATLSVTRPGSRVYDDIDAILFYVDFTVALKAGLLIREKRPAYVLRGTSGLFIKHRADVQEDDLKAGRIPGGVGRGTEPVSAEGKLTITTEGQISETFIQTKRGNYMELFEGLHDSIINKTAPPVPAADGVRTMQIIDAIALSSELQVCVILRNGLMVD